jgi:predicted CopG family antitoxin
MAKIRIDNDLYEKLQKCAAAAGYSGAEEFIMHVLEKAAAGVGSDDDAERVKEKLRGLGYLS